MTGGAGFIGSAFVLRALAAGHEVVNLDKLTYAADRRNLEAAAGAPGYRFVQADICDAAAVAAAFAAHAPDRILHLAAESHVDRSIDGPAAFIATNIVGTSVLLEQALAYWRGLDGARSAGFRFHHVSTDEVFGELGSTGYFDEATPYGPRSPYSASKAASDHLVRAWHATYGLPVLVTNCSNNYGPRQHPEKLIPVVILKSISGEPIPVYGRGENVRDWLHVEDHAAALMAVLERGRVGETYAIGGDAEVRNIDLVTRICAILDELRPTGAPHARLITFVTDRPGHDRRYAINASRIRSELGWRPAHDLDVGLRSTVAWYLANEDRLRSAPGAGERLGLERVSGR